MQKEHLCELIQLSPKRRLFLYFKSCKKCLNFSFPPYFYKVIQASLFVVSYPICMSEQCTAWAICGSAALTGDNSKEAGITFFP